MIDALKGMTIVSWGGYQYFEENIIKLDKKIKIDYLYANKNYVKNVDNYNILERKEQIESLQNPFVVISQAKVEDIQKAARWCKERNVPFTHLEFLINDNKYSIKYIKAIGGIYKDFNRNVIKVSENARGNIIIETSEAQDSYATIDNISVKERLYIKLFGRNAKFSIGEGTTIVSANIIVNSNGRVKIGNDCMLSHSISLMQSDQHQIFDIDTGKRINHTKNIAVGNHVWIGRECELLAGATIGDNCVCGARTTTSGSFPANSIIAGCPAKIVRKGIIWARDNIKDKECDFYSDCKDQAALKYMNKNEDELSKICKKQKSFEETVIALYENGITTQEIENYIEEHYGKYYSKNLK